MLPPLPELMLFFAAALALNLTPGADMLYAMGAGLRSGPRAGFVAALGISLGLGVHVLLAGLGLAALIASHPAAFELIRWAGVVWLIWLAYGAFTAGPAQLRREGAGESLPKVLKGGFLVNLLNPKTIIFILAFIPQFTDGGLAQFLLLGACFVTSSLVVTGLIGASAGGLGAFLTRRPALSGIIQKLSGSVMLLLAARLAFDRR